MFHAEGDQGEKGEERQNSPAPHQSQANAEKKEAGHDQAAVFPVLVGIIVIKAHQPLILPGFDHKQADDHIGDKIPNNAQPAED